MPKILSSETRKQIRSEIESGMYSNKEIAGRHGVSEEFVSRFKQEKPAGGEAAPKGERGEIPLQTYEIFCERERLKSEINGAFAGAEQMMLQCAARDCVREKSKIRMSLVKKPNGLDVEFSFDDPKSLARQGWVETWIPSDGLRIFLINSYLTDRWKSKHELLERMKGEALKLVEGADLEEARKIAQKFQAGARHEFDTLKRELESSYRERTAE